MYEREPWGAGPGLHNRIIRRNVRKAQERRNAKTIPWSERDPRYRRDAILLACIAVLLAVVLVVGLLAAAIVR